MADKQIRTTARSAGGDVGEARWLMLVFQLSAKQASQRVEVWRRLRRLGALPFRSSGYLLPNSPDNQERFEWLAAAVRNHRGEASVLQVQSFDDLSDGDLRQTFLQERRRDYEQILKEAAKAKRDGEISRLRKRLLELSEIDYFVHPLRSKAEEALRKAGRGSIAQEDNMVTRAKTTDYQNRTWLTRPRPGIDRVSSAWLIRTYIDHKARFQFGLDPAKHRRAVPFDMYQPGGFGHRGEDCTFETLCKEFGIRDKRTLVMGQIIHDADLEDDKFGRSEGTAILKILRGWARQGVKDREIMRRGMELIEGLYRSLE